MIAQRIQKRPVWQDKLERAGIFGDNPLRLALFSHSIYDNICQGLRIQLGDWIIYKFQNND
ncbi:MAG: hypothetical protein PUP91_38265 [Rhizonema sp. PD37]|nr:hypothetical protein [Rhizonema sp. PD37]